MDNLSTPIIGTILLIVCVFALVTYGKKLKNGCCGGGDTEIRIKPENGDPSHYPHKVTVFIDGITCEHCKRHVENTFHRKPGCLARVNLRKKCAEIWSEKPLSDNEIKETVKAGGYTYVDCVHEK